MKRHWRPLAALVPLLAAVAVAAIREAYRALPTAPPAVATRPAVPVTIPPTFKPRSDQSLPLDEGRSTARFCVRDAGGERTMVCTGVSGSLSCGPAGQPDRFELQLDLDRVYTEDGAPASADRWHLLGARAGETVRFHGRAFAIEQFPIAGTSRIRWAGPLRFGGSVHSAVMDLYCAWVSPRSCRMQGLGQVDTAALGLPRRYHVGLWPEHHEITLALDLAFAPRSR